MDRHALALTKGPLLVTLSLVAFLSCQTGFAQSPNASKQTPPETPSGSSDSGSSNDAPAKGARAENLEALRNALHSLSPQEKQRLIENLRGLKQLTPEQKQALKQREGALKKQIEEELSAAEPQIPEAKREAFRKSYIEKRKHLEATLRHEYEKRRKASLAELMETLKKEFQTPPSEAASSPPPSSGEASKTP